MCVFSTNFKGSVVTDKIQKTTDEWRAELTPEQFRVCRQCGTEAPFTGEYWDCHDRGMYRCVCCNNALFDSEVKYESGSGWPSFWQPLPDSIVTRLDTQHGIERTEVLCRKCEAHLGHVFDDGPEPTGLRFCINSAVLILDRQ